MELEDWLPARLVFIISLFLTLAPHDYVIYYQARGLSGHTSPRGECAGFFLEDYMPLEEDSLLPWSDSKWAHLVHCEEIFYSKLELLTPLWQAVLGSYCSVVVLATRNCLLLLSNSSWWSDHEFGCLALFAPARTSTRRRCSMGTRRSGTSYGGYNPGYPRHTTWATPLGAA